MDFLLALEEAKANLENNRFELEAARQMVVDLEAEHTKMTLELAGIEAFAKRSGLTETAALPDADVVPISPDINLNAGTGADLIFMTRTAAVVAVMAAAHGPLDRAAIHEGLFDGGRTDELDKVSLTLSGLKRAGKVEKLGNGLWQLEEDQLTAELG